MSQPPLTREAHLLRLYDRIDGPAPLASLLLSYSIDMEDESDRRKSIQAKVHPFCLVCSGSNPYGLTMKFEAFSEGILTASFQANPALEGYEGRLHGGVTAALLDGIMTNRLFAEGIVAVTGELRVRYRNPVLIGAEISLQGWIENRHPPLFFMCAELKQDGCIRATASAKFMQQHA